MTTHARGDLTTHDRSRVVFYKVKTIQINYELILILAAALYTVALHFCSGNTIPIINAYKRPSVLTARNANIAQTSVGVTY